MTTPCSPIMEHEQEGHDHDYEEEAAAASASGCNCFQFFSFKRTQHNDYNYLLNQPKGETWVVNNLKKVKEASEVVAGPKWKTFIRKISVYIKKMKKQNNNANNNNQFQYDPQSYALNFDGSDQEDDLLLPIFSSRFAVPSNVNDDKGQSGL